MFPNHSPDLRHPTEKKLPVFSLPYSLAFSGTDFPAF